MQVPGDWIKAKSIQDVLAMLGGSGYQACLVGGCVRNALIGQPIADIDVATDALPEQVAALARLAGYKLVPTGIAHGTVTVIVGGESYEITTFRRDIATDGRHASVVFSTDLAEDASRRDFTMNALYADASGQVIDPLGGLPDLLARQVRFVGDAGARIREDYLRILRFFRFHAWYGDPAEGMDPEALAACATHAAGIGQLSRERVGHEMRRLLAAPDPAPAVAAMHVAGVLHRVLPGADPKALSPLVHLDTGYPAHWLRRLAALGGADLPAALRLSRAEAKTLRNLSEGIGSAAGAAELGYRFGGDTARDIVLLRAALLETPMPDGWQDQIHRGENARFPLRSGDLMPAYGGRALGAKLEELEATWIASGFELSREQLLS